MWRSLYVMLTLTHLHQKYRTVDRSIQQIIFTCFIFPNYVQKIWPKQMQAKCAINDREYAATLRKNAFHFFHLHLMKKKKELINITPYQREHIRLILSLSLYFCALRTEVAQTIAILYNLYIYIFTHWPLRTSPTTRPICEPETWHFASSSTSTVSKPWANGWFCN